MKNGSSGRRVAFEVDGETLTVHDVIEGQELRMTADREPTLSPALPELFPLPVDDAFSFEAESIAVPEYSSVTVRDANGDLYAQLDEAGEFPRGSYCLEINGDVKTLVRVTDIEMSATGVIGPEPVEFAFDRAATVTVGARSLHSKPEATITVPDDPTALTEAVSVLGSSIKEFSPERSWPTLRGYPPLIERGDSLDIPSRLTVPDTGVEVVVRPTYADVYRLSTLSYYLGARMVTGDRPAIRLENGYEEQLPIGGPALERRVEELFRTWFFLDTLARTEGYVPSNRYEYEHVGGEFPFYPPNLADSSMSERLMEYLEVDPETVAPYAPAWTTEAILRPTPEAAELLPHFAHVLAPIRVRGDAEQSDHGAPTVLATSPQALVARPQSGERSVPTPGTDPVPPGVSVTSSTAYENQLGRELPDRGEVSAAFLVTDPERASSVRESLSAASAPDSIGSWTVHVRPDRETVTEVFLNSTLDIVFCALPVTENHVESAAGPVDLTALPVQNGRAGPALCVFENGWDLSAAVTMVDRGGISGLVLDDTARPDQIRTFLGLLGMGASVALATSLAFNDDDANARFAGDPAASIATDRDIPVHLYRCLAVEPDSFRILFRSYLSTQVALGREIRQVIDPLDSKSSLVGAPEREIGQVGRSGIHALHDEKGPVLRFSDDLVFWSDDLTDKDLTAFAQRLSRETIETEPDECSQS